MEEEEEPWHPFEFTQPEPTWKPATDDKGNFIFQGTGEWKPIDWVLMVKAVDEFLGKIKEEGAIYDLQTAPYEEYESFTKTQDIPDWVPVSGLGRGIIDWGDAEGISWKGKDGARYSITETDHSSIVKPTSDGAFEKAGEGPEECQMTDPEQENHEMFWGTISQAKAEEAEETLDAQINRPEPEVYVNQDGSCRPYYLIEGDKRTASMGNQFTYCDGRYKNTDLEIHPSEEDRGIEKLDSEPYHGNTWAGVGLYGKRDSKHHSDDTETDESRQYELTSGGSTVYAKTNASYPSGIDETTVLSLPEPNVRTPEQVDAEVQEILHRLGLGEETVTRSCGDVFVDLNCERPKNLLDKEDQAKAGDRLITVRKPIPRKKAWSPELRQALAGRKSKTFIAQELVWMLFGEIGAGGSIDFMKTVDMVNIVLGIRPISIYM
jgi:hypothetical protein